MTDFENLSTKELFDAVNEKTLYAAVMENGGKPVYTVDTFELLGELTNNYKFYVNDIYAALLRKGAHYFREPIKAKTPVIMLIKNNTKAVKTICDILRGAGVKVLFQDANKPFKEVTSTGINEIVNDLAEQYRANYSAGGTIKEFDNVIESSANTPAIKTGFRVLDKVLDGGLYEGLYAVGAITSLGKTTFCLNIGEQIAASGQDVIIIALEMSKYSLMSRSISRLTFIRYLNNQDKISYDSCKTARGISDGSRYKNYNADELEIIKTARNFYAANIGQHLFIHEAIGNLTVDNIRYLVTRHIEYTGNRPVVIIDYLQLLKNKDERINANDKTRIDYNLTELKQLSRDYKLPILLISSFNRGGYNTEVKFECFKESGGIDFGCDVIIGLQLAGVGTSDFNVNEAKAKDPREIELVFLKNREAAVGDIIKYYYYPKFNHFQESEEDPRAEREYKAEQEQKRREKEKQNKAEQLRAEHLELVNVVFKACEENGIALITDMVNFCGGKPTANTLTRYIKEAGNYNILGNKVTKK